MKLPSAIGRNEALTLACSAAEKRPAAPSADHDVSSWHVFSDDLGAVTHGHLYTVLQEPAWYVRAPCPDGYDALMLRSSRIIVVSKRNVRIHL